MAFNFKNASVVKEKFVRKITGISKGQNFNFKFRPYLSISGRAKAVEEGLPFIPSVAHEFRFSDKYMEQYDFQNHSVAIVIDADKNGLAQSVALAITPEGHDEANTFKKKGNADKSPLFTHHFLMTRLVEAGIIEVPEMTIDKTAVDDQDPLLSKNQLLDLVYVANVVDIVKDEEGYMEPCEEDEGIAVYEVVKGEEVEEDELSLED